MNASSVFNIFSWRRLGSLGLLVVVSLTMTGCDWFKSDDGEVITSLVPAPKKVLLWVIGSSRQLKPIAYNQYDKPMSSQPSFSYAIDNSKVATVDANGNVKALTLGTAIVTVAAGDFKVEIPVTITDKTLRISGSIHYQDRVYNQFGFTADEKHLPLRFSESEIADENGDELIRVKTDANGAYETIVGANPEYRVRAVARSNGDNGIRISVKDWKGATHAISKPVTAGSSTDITADLYIPASGSISGVFNMYDVMMSGAEFGQYLTSTKDFKLNVFWQENRGGATYYCEGIDILNCPQGTGIYVQHEAAGSVRDDDEFDDDVLWHEFAHYLMSKFSKDDSPGGCHRLASNDLDLRLSWSEGWGDYFPAAIKSWLNADTQRANRLSTAYGVPLSVYVDTVLTDSAPFSATTISVNIANPDSNNETHRYATNEIAVAKVLWEVTRYFDSLSVWQVAQNYLKTAEIATLESFWDGLMQIKQPDIATRRALETIFAERGIYYVEDSPEVNSIADAVLLSVGPPTPSYHLYLKNGQFDVDYFKFDGVAGKKYTVSTVGLTNGADTYLKVTNAAGDFSIDNDDIFSSVSPYYYERYDALCQEVRPHNDDLSLSSSVSFTASTSGTYYVLVSRTNDNPPYPSAARYGSYQVEIK